MLDGLVAEARQRWGLDPAAGLQVVPAEALVAFPIEASRPLLIVPISARGAHMAGTAAPVPGRDVRHDLSSAAPPDPPAAPVGAGRLACCVLCWSHALDTRSSSAEAVRRSAGSSLTASRSVRRSSRR